MSPSQAINALDRQLAAHGQGITLRRYSGVGPSRVPVDVTVRARVDDYRPEELSGGIVQGDTRVIISPSQILAAAWPSPQDWPRAGDQVVINGRVRNVEAPVLLKINDTVVRIEIQVKG